jgi:hypothetical protein
MNHWSRKLTSFDACSDAVAWAKTKKSFAVAWQSCDRGDWMLWLAARLSDTDRWPTRQHVVLAACDCAETSLKFVPAGEDRPRIAIETARKWALGTATIGEVRKAKAAAYAAAYAASASSYAAYAAAYAASASSSDDEAARTNLAHYANIVRKRLAVPEVL